MINSFTHNNIHCEWGRAAFVHLQICFNALHRCSVCSMFVYEISNLNFMHFPVDSAGLEMLYPMVYSTQPIHSWTIKILVEFMIQRFDFKKKKIVLQIVMCSNRKPYVNYVLYFYWKWKHYDFVLLILHLLEWTETPNQTRWTLNFIDSY